MKLPLLLSLALVPAARADETALQAVMAGAKARSQALNRSALLAKDVVSKLTRTGYAEIREAEEDGKSAWYAVPPSKDDGARPDWDVELRSETRHFDAGPMLLTLRNEVRNSSGDDAMELTPFRTVQYKADARTGRLASVEIVDGVSHYFGNARHPSTAAEFKELWPWVLNAFGASDIEALIQMGYAAARAAGVKSPQPIRSEWTKGAETGSVRVTFGIKGFLAFDSVTGLYVMWSKSVEENGRRQGWARNYDVSPEGVLLNATGNGSTSRTTTRTPTDADQAEFELRLAEFLKSN